MLRPGECGERRAETLDRSLEGAASPSQGGQGFAPNAPGPCVPGLEMYFVTARLRVDLLGVNEQAPFELLDSGPAGADGARTLQGLKQ